MVNVTAWVGLLGAVIGAAASTITTWLGQRSQLRRETLQRDYQERTVWRSEKRILFRDIQGAALEWMRILRNVAAGLADGNDNAVSDDDVLSMERKFHLLGYESDLLSDSSGVISAVDELEDTLRIWSRKLGKPTDFKWPQPYVLASPELAREAAVEALGDDFQQIDEIRVRLMRAMRQELRGRGTDWVIPSGSGTPVDDD